MQAQFNPTRMEVIHELITGLADRLLAHVTLRKYVIKK